MAETQGTAAMLGAVLADKPDVLEHLTAAHQAAVAAVDPRLLELCGQRIAQLLGSRGGDTPTVVDAATLDALAQWPTSDRFTATDRACLAFTEQFVIDVATLDDATAFAVVDVLGDDGFATFVNALLVVEQRQRLHLVWSRLFDEVPT
jgi:alkylhydroperoxidase family enzyme